MDELTISLADSGDKKGTLLLLNTVFKSQQASSKNRNEDLWTWKYEKNVFGKGKVVIIKKSGDIIAAGALWPWKFVCRGVVLKAYQPCDTVVHPNYQGIGLFSMLNDERLSVSNKDEIDIIFNFPNSNSLPGYLNKGWSYNGKILWRVKVFKPIKTAISKFSNDKVTSIEVPELYKIRMEDVENVANEPLNYTQFIRTQKSPDYINWRYIQHPSRQYGIVKFELRKRIKAAVVFSILSKAESREMFIMDYLGSPRYSKELFEQVIIQARKLKVNFVATMDNPYFRTNSLWRKGFVNYYDKNFTALPLSLGIESKATNINSWELVAGMHDSI